MIDKYLTHLINKVNDDVSQLQTSMADGHAKDYPEYKRMCGEVKGLLTARLYIIGLQERLINDDEWNLKLRLG